MASARLQASEATAKKTPTMTTLLASVGATRRWGMRRSATLPTQRVAGQTSRTTIVAVAESRRPATRVAAMCAVSRLAGFSRRAVAQSTT